MHCTVVYVHTYVCKYVHVQHKATLPLPLKITEIILFTELGIVIKNQKKIKNEFQIQV